MRRFIIGVIGIGLLSVIFIVVTKAVNTSELVQEKITVVESNSNRIPLFEFSTLDSLTYSKYDLNDNKSLILVYFDPDCGLCEKSGQVFNTFKKVHEASQVVFVSHNTKGKIIGYQERFNLDTVTNIQFLQCNADDFYTLFKETNTPTYFIYNTKQELVKIINDDVPVETILRYIKAAQIES
jgi:protein-disulfide isomerase